MITMEKDLDQLIQSIQTNFFAAKKCTDLSKKINTIKNI